MKKVKFILPAILLFIACWAYGQEISKNDIELGMADSPHQGRIHVSSIKNKSKDSVRILFINEYGNGSQVKELKAGESKTVDITCNLVKAKVINGNNDYIQLYWKKKIDKRNGQLTIEDIVLDFNNYLESIPDLSSSHITEETSAIDEHIKSLRNWKDKDAYISEHHLNKYINACNDSLSRYRKNATSFVYGYFSKYNKINVIDENECIDSIQAILSNRLAQREANIKRLSDEINTVPESDSLDWKNLDWKNLDWKKLDWKKLEWRLIGIGAGLLLFIIILFAWFVKANKKNRTTTLSNNGFNGHTDASSSIVVRRKTTSILRKQSLEDVIDNDAYLKIDCDEFCENSAVRRMYIKNTCIKDIYNMYAEDLRNPNNPKEDGCMVLGRWVHDDQSNEYYVSLEHIVLPGDDAVFSEYELNFGGKIKLKVAEKLRKLRRETNLQYDLTCWVHSHPGLGVFFSNSDNNVQMQLKHPTHPNFLTAIVVDILTPQQELGIFTFKRDSLLNSKADLKKLYSLEELYKWAVESDRNSFKPEDHYNTLADAKSHHNDCYGIELSNGAIIDMGMLVAEHHSGLTGMIHGYSNQQGLKTEHIATTVSKNDAVPDNEFVGCFIIATHCSIPSIRKAINSYMGKIKFVLIYTTTDGLLTSVPIVNQEICTDENYYGEQKLEDLKIWTRRKR